MTPQEMSGEELLREFEDVSMTQGGGDDEYEALRKELLRRLGASGVPQTCEHREPCGICEQKETIRERVITAGASGVDVEGLAREIANATIGPLLHATNGPKKITTDFIDEVALETAAILRKHIAQPAAPKWVRCPSRQPHGERVQCELQAVHKTVNGLHLCGEYCWNEPEVTPGKQEESNG